MNNEYIVHVIKKVRIFVVNDEFPNETDSICYYATIYDSGTHLNTTHGDSYEEARRKAVEWVYDNFNVPKSIETLEYRQPEEVDEE